MHQKLKTMYLTRAINKRMQEVGEQLGIGNISTYVARHTFATLALTAGVDIYTTSQLLGHTTIRHTQRYARIINSKKNDAVSLLDSAFVQ